MIYGRINEPVNHLVNLFCLSVYVGVIIWKQFNIEDGVTLHCSTMFSLFLACAAECKTCTTSGAGNCDTCKDGFTLKANNKGCDGQLTYL